MVGLSGGRTGSWHYFLAHYCSAILCAVYCGSAMLPISTSICSAIFSYVCSHNSDGSCFLSGFRQPCNGDDWVVTNHQMQPKRDFMGSRPRQVVSGQPCTANATWRLFGEHGDESRLLTSGQWDFVDRPRDCQKCRRTSLQVPGKYAVREEPHICRRQRSNPRGDQYR